jgi:hypothetical protein
MTHRTHSMTTPTNAQQVAIMRTILAVLETVCECPDGAPAGPMYMAMMHSGFSLEQFESLMSILLDAKLVRKVGHLYYPTERGQSVAGDARKPATAPTSF